MQISKDGIDLIKSFEGCCYTAYQDINGVWTIGYGHATDVQPGETITPAQAIEMLTADLAQYEGYVNAYVTVPLLQRQFDALVSFTYNVGPGTLRRSDLLAFLNAGQYERAADAFLEYDHADGVEVAGLKRRREAERTLFLAPRPVGLLNKLVDWWFR